MLIAVAGCEQKSEQSTVTEKQNSVAEKSHPDFNGVWQIRDFDEIIRPEYDKSNYTEEHARRVARYWELFPEGKSKTPVEFCLYQGMPWTMLTRGRTYGTEIYQSEDRIVVYQEGFDMVRTIHLNRTEFPKNFSPSNQGYSIGHWEGDELVVETRGLTASNEIAEWQRTENTVIHERWTFQKDPNGDPQGDRVEINILMDDPELYKKPGVGYQMYYRAPAGTVIGGYNCPNTLWDDYVEEVLSRLEENQGDGAE
jgi:hypothetical protein